MTAQSSLLALALALAVLPPAGAASAALPPPGAPLCPGGASRDRPHAAGVTAAYQHTFRAGAFYERCLHPVGWSRTAELRAAWTTPLLLASPSRAWALELGGSLVLVRSARWAAIHRLSFAVHRASLDAYEGVSLLMENRVVAGLFLPRWTAGVEVGHRQILGALVQPSAAYRQVFPDARAGWYRLTGGYWTAGLAVATTFGSTRLVLRAGWEWTARLRSPAPPTDFVLPYTAEVEVQARF